MENLFSEIEKQVPKEKYIIQVNETFQVIVSSCKWSGGTSDDPEKLSKGVSSKIELRNSNGVVEFCVKDIVKLKTKCSTIEPWLETEEFQIDSIYRLYSRFNRLRKNVWMRVLITKKEATLILTAEEWIAFLSLVPRIVFVALHYTNVQHNRTEILPLQI